MISSHGNRSKPHGWIPLLVAPLAIACNLVSALGERDPVIEVWLVQPVPEATLRMQPTTLEARAVSTGGGVSGLTFWVNASAIGETGTDDSLTEVSGSIEWTPPGPGIYTLQVEARGRGGSVLSRPIRVCVAQGNPPAGPSTGECGEATAPGALGIEVEASPTNLYIGGSCGSGANLHLNATLSPEPDGAQVEAALAFDPASGIPGSVTVALSPAGPGSFVSDFDIAQLGGDLGAPTATLTFVVRVRGPEGGLLGESAPGAVTVYECGPGGPPPTPTSTISPAAPSATAPPSGPPAGPTATKPSGGSPPTPAPTTRPPTQPPATAVPIEEPPTPELPPPPLCVIKPWLCETPPAP